MERVAATKSLNEKRVTVHEGTERRPWSPWSLSTQLPPPPLSSLDVDAKEEEEEEEEDGPR